MYAKLFAESGLSLDRLKALVEVGAAGSIVRATGGDPIRQSQYSRQIKELEGFFQTNLMERLGKGIRLTENGKELARISRFFLLGLSNFQRGCLAEEQIFRIGSGSAFTQSFLIPALALSDRSRRNTRFVVETVRDSEIERRLHDLTLDFGIVTSAALSRPLQLRDLWTWHLKLWVPRGLYKSEKAARQAFAEKTLPLVLTQGEFDLAVIAWLKDFEPQLTCANFFEALAAMKCHKLAALLPDFFPVQDSSFLSVRLEEIEAKAFTFRLAWNPRLLRLNPHARRQRDALAQIRDTDQAVG